MDARHVGDAMTRDPRVDPRVGDVLRFGADGLDGDQDFECYEVSGPWSCWAYYDLRIQFGPRHPLTEAGASIIHAEGEHERE